MHHNTGGTLRQAGGWVLTENTCRPIPSCLLDIIVAVTPFCDHCQEQLAWLEQPGVVTEIAELVGYDRAVDDTCRGFQDISQVNHMNIIPLALAG